MKKTEPKKTDQYQWDLKLFYASPNDPQIEKDIQKIEQAYKKFAEKYSTDKKYTMEAVKLLESLDDWDALTRLAETWKPAHYFGNLKNIDSSNVEVTAHLARIENRLQSAANQILFYPISLGKIPSKLKKEYLSDKKLEKYRHFLEVTFESSQHDLTEAEEKINKLKALPAYHMWVHGQEKVLNSQIISFKGKKMPVAKAIGICPGLPTASRRALFDAIQQKMKDISDFAEAELNAIITNKKIDDDLRGFKEPYSGTMISYQNDEKSILKLADTVTKHAHISSRFYALKAKLLKMKHLEYADIAAKIGKISKKFPLEQGIKIVEESFGSMNPEYAKVFKDMVDNKQIDFLPRQGKRGGAYCTWFLGEPTLILMNYNEEVRSITTLAHEMGHALNAHHSFKSGLPAVYSSATISTTEVASTFFENIIIDRLYSELNDKEKIVLLCEKIDDLITTVMVQIACFNYEQTLHKRIREEGYLSAQEFAREWIRHIQPFFGPSVKLKELDGYRFVRWMHLRYFFYTYSYAYGSLISTALYKRYKKDPSYLKKIESFLSAGSSKSSEQIFKDIGIDTADPDFWAEGLKAIEDDIARLEKLVK